MMRPNEVNVRVPSNAAPGVKLAGLIPPQALNRANVGSTKKRHSV